MSILQSTNKKALRKAMTTALRELPQSDVQSQSQAITEKVLSLPAFQECKTVSCYLSMPAAEVQTTSLISNILGNLKKALFVPSITPSDGCMNFVRVYTEEDYRSFPSGLWGIPDPTPEWSGKKRHSVFDADCSNLDLILVPGVAFDRSLSRLGHGKGYYDRFLTSYRSSAGRSRPLLVALALKEQLLEHGQVPMLDHDWKMDMIITPDEVITAPQGQEC
ncbi:5-formyltetrahydrofolate cyclo-ligase [Rhizopogon vinicolor AM-OR11-026]|uniref:5-formyltetrahydrofolate cyclo-ligase n=1 Tax=Rhizopogon vinicolor AM-OR11-026 TaxID=1314800 RepID=A0A1B7N9U8_9AGAM|nr:5-formyltetrahydrofolate cyclo-ligase [Rhizopogon vinicolor AM-OR11-026]